MPSTTQPPTSLPFPPNRAPNSTLSHRSLLTPGQPTPSLLTPNTRSEAEAALTANSLYQTDAAAPTTPMPGTAAADGDNLTGPNGPDEEELEERRQSLGLGVRPPFPTRSSTNYFNAVAVAMKGKLPAPGVTGEVKGDAGENESQQLEGGPVGGTQSQALEGEVANWQPKVDRQQSWNEQDKRRLMQQQFMQKATESDMGYDSAA